MIIPDLYRFKKGTKHVPKLIRRIHCVKCNTVIAEEVTDKHNQTAYEWRSITPEGIWITGRWWGNHFKCPVCGAEGNLPIDKPLRED
jgi:transcription elongation factor Elf1